MIRTYRKPTTVHATFPRSFSEEVCDLAERIRALPDRHARATVSATGLGSVALDVVGIEAQTVRALAAEAGAPVGQVWTVPSREIVRLR